MQPMRLRVFERTMNRLHHFIICKTCESLFSPKKEVCPVCSQAVEIGAKPRAFRILPHVVCGNCGSLVSAKACFCPICETLMNHRVRCKIVEQPVELEIIKTDGGK
jgi:RNA polymerase subunit RPABC4/transcription elongation factor Spt4